LGNLAWLCRAADHGQVNARNELGELYFYGSDKYRKFENVHISSDLSRSCMWFDLAGYAQIIGEPKRSNIQHLSGSYKSAEVERTAKVMTAHELAEAERLILTWEPGQCDRDISLYLSAPRAANSGMSELCAAADKGGFTARDELGRIYFFCSNSVEADLPRAYMWYRLAANVYLPPSLDDRVIQNRCNAMTPEQRSISVKLLEEWKLGKCERDLLH
jgi:TPR repeat protein